MPNITAPQNTAASSTTAMRRKTSNACARRRAVCILPVSGSESAMRKTAIRAANIPAIQHSAVTASCDSGTSTCTGADFAYTLDGDTENEIQYENFNACSASIEFHGVSVHPGSSKDTMVNASLVAMEFDSMLPKGETPRDTEGYEGFYHLLSMEGECALAKLHYIIRDHDAEKFEQRKKVMKQITDDLNQKWGDGTVMLTLKDQYRNMSEIIAQHMHLIDNAKKACETVGLTPQCLPIRGGTDGCQLSFRGLPCPNLGTGGHAYHGPYEHITVEGMEKAVDMITELVKIYSTQCK